MYIKKNNIVPNICTLSFSTFTDLKEWPTFWSSVFVTKPTKTASICILPNTTSMEGHTLIIKTVSITLTLASVDSNDLAPE